MGDTYHFDIPFIVINIIHILAGLWLGYVGYKKINSEEIHELNHKILFVLGVIMIVYFSITSYKNIGKSWNYKNGVPNWMVFATHIVNAIMFIMIGLKYINKPFVVGIYLGIIGTLASLYHSYLIFQRY